VHSSDGEARGEVGEATFVAGGDWLADGSVGGEVVTSGEGSCVGSAAPLLVALVALGPRGPTGPSSIRRGLTITTFRLLGRTAPASSRFGGERGAALIGRKWVSSESMLLLLSQLSVL
jgi:hypothetical protein